MDRLTESFKLLAGLKAEIALMDEGGEITPELPGSTHLDRGCAGDIRKPALCTFYYCMLIGSIMIASGYLNQFHITNIEYRSNERNMI